MLDFKKAKKQEIVKFFEGGLYFNLDLFCN